MKKENDLISIYDETKENVDELIFEIYFNFAKKRIQSRLEDSRKYTFD